MNERDITFDIQHQPRHGFVKRTSYGVIASGMLLLGCTDKSDDMPIDQQISVDTAEVPLSTDNEVEATIPTATLAPAVRLNQTPVTTTGTSAPDLAIPSVPAEDCGLRSVDVGQNFTANNDEKISNDLDLLTRLSNDQDLMLGDIWTALSIIHQSREDPLFAEAVFKAHEVIKTGQLVQADQFLMQDVNEPVLCTEDRISRDDLRAQLFHTVVMSDYIISEMAESFSESSIEALKQLSDSVRAEFEELEQNIADE